MKISIAKAILPLAAAASLAGAAIAQQPGIPAPPHPKPMQPGRHPERHPKLRQALMALNRAERALEGAARDFHGHRDHALDLVKHAISEVKAAWASDKSK